MYVCCSPTCGRTTNNCQLWSCQVDRAYWHWRWLTDTIPWETKPKQLLFAHVHLIPWNAQKPNLSVSLNSLSFQFHKLTLLSFQEGILSNGMHLLEKWGGWTSQSKGHQIATAGFLSTQLAFELISSPLSPNAIKSDSLPHALPFIPRI